MSVQAMTWAFDRDLPAKPKMVLMALANRADRATGKCWPGMALLSKEASVPERTLVRYIHALVRNGYVIRVKSRDASGHQKTNTYFLCLDRDPEKWGKWSFASHEPIEDDDALESESGADPEGEPTAKLAPGENTLPTAIGGSSPTAIDGSQEPPFEPKDKAKESILGTMRAGFSRDEQEKAMEDLHIELLAADKNAKCFVIEGSRAWTAWLAYRAKRGQIASLPTCAAVIGGKRQRGWYLPSLFPPQEPATGPPTQPQSMMTEADERELASSGR